jgi:hypothetical protein
MLGARIRGEA